MVNKIEIPIPQYIDMPKKNVTKINKSLKLNKYLDTFYSKEYINDYFSNTKKSTKKKEPYDDIRQYY